MLNYLKGCTEQTLIGMLPDIITHNNNAIKNEFEYIYDSSLNRLTKSVYAPTGSVKAHFGEFVNLAVEYISIKNLDALSETILQAVANEHHNVVKGRFDSSMSETLFTNTNYCHNASIIAYDASYNVYQQIRHTVKWVTDLSVYVDTSVTKIIDDMQEKVDKAEADTLDLSIYVHDIESKIDDISSAAWNAKRDTDDISIYVHSIEYKIDDISSAAWTAKHDTDNISIYVHSIESKIEDISATADKAYEYSYDLSIYVHKMESKLNDISAKADNAYDYAYDLSVYVHNASIKEISDVSKVAHDASAVAHSALDMAINNTTVISKLANDINSSIAIIDNSIAIIDSSLSIIDNSINIVSDDLSTAIVELKLLKNNVTSISTNVLALNTSVSNISINIDSMQVQVDDLSTQLDNIRNANFLITYNSSTYELSDIVRLIDWKNSITSEIITVLSGGQMKTLNVLCFNSLTSTVITSNARLNQLTGETTTIDNPEDYTSLDVDDAANQMNNLL